MIAAQALDFRLPQRPLRPHGPRHAAAYEMVRERVPFLEQDVDFQPHIAACVDLVLSGMLAGALGVSGGDKAGVAG